MYLSREVFYSFLFVFSIFETSVSPLNDTSYNFLPTEPFGIRFGIGCIGLVSFEILWSQAVVNTPIESECALSVVS